MECIYGATVERQLKDATATFLLSVNPFARECGVAGLGDEPTFCEYLERLEKAVLKTGQRKAYRFAVHQLFELAAVLGRMAEWHSDVHDLTGARYAAYRLDGSDHKWADMMAHQRPPGCMTDREFLEGHCNGNQFEGQEWVGDQYKRMAEAAGVDTTGAVYVNGLAAFAGDPKAWVRGRGDVARVCAERGYNAQGAVAFKSGPRDPAPDVDVADDIVDRRLASKLEADPSLALKGLGELRHEARQEIKPHWSAAAA